MSGNWGVRRLWRQEANSDVGSWIATERGKTDDWTRVRYKRL